MTHKRFFIWFVVSLLFFLLAFAGFNILTDPFGVFGDVIMDWYSYNMTMNPRVAKIAYLDRRHADYDSFLIGCSKTSSFPDELMTKYYDGDRFYNMFTYGGDTYGTELTVKYVLDNYEAKRIVVNLGIEELTRYNILDRDPIKNNLHAKVDGSGLLKFYGKYMFVNPTYGWDKIESSFRNGYLVNGFKVFNAVTGAYDKSLRDIEPIGSLDEYLKKYPALAHPPTRHKTLPEIDNCLASIKRIADMCDAAGVELTMVISPVHHLELDAFFADGELLTFLRELAGIMPYWDFTGYTSVSFEPRYFYDVYHFRNAIGAMMLARMFDDESVYIPEDFGYYVTAENVELRLEAYWFFIPVEVDAKVPILLYHNIVEAVGDYDADVTPERFEEHISAMREAGINAITFQQLTDFIERGATLPPNPVLITFDGGYESVITYAAPVLRKYDMRATANIIGVLVGKDVYKDTGARITPRFSWEYISGAAGVIDVQSMGYDVHRFPDLDADDYREGVLRKDGETELEYVSFFKDDFERARSGIYENLGTPLTVYAYPFGKYNNTTEVILSEMSIKATLTDAPGENTVIKGLPQSLRLLRRLNVTQDMDIRELINYILEDRS